MHPVKKFTSNFFFIIRCIIILNCKQSKTRSKCKCRAVFWNVVSALEKSRMTMTTWANKSHSLLRRFINSQLSGMPFTDFTLWLAPNWNLGLSQVGFWTSHAKSVETAAQGNTTVFTPVTAARDSSRGASEETEPTSVNLALRWGLLLIYYKFSFDFYMFPFQHFHAMLKWQNFVQ